jgi:hypothetical protein
VELIGQIQLLEECQHISWAKYPHDYIGDIDDTTILTASSRLFVFIFLGFTVCLVLKVDRLKRFLVFGFGFSTYLIIILGVGHNAKACMLFLYASRYRRFYIGFQECFRRFSYDVCDSQK